MKPEVFTLRGDFITLDALLKATGLAPSGGAAKLMVGEGQVKVDGQVELRKTCKIRAGQRVTLAGACVEVKGDPAGPASAQADELGPQPGQGD